jgi:hypothetical protein
MIGFLNRISGRHHHLLFWRAHVYKLMNEENFGSNAARDVLAQGSFLGRSKVHWGRGKRWTFGHHELNMQTDGRLSDCFGLRNETVGYIVIG